jgi:thiol:disulfide interchange protein DsbG
VVKNTALMNRYGLASVPSIVAKHAQTGALVTREGGLPTPELAALLGLQVPAAQ